jgi:hypothetical protein
LLKVSSSPGQTAKLIGLSAAGFKFAVNIGGKNQGDSLLGDKNGGVPPGSDWENEGQNGYQNVFFHDVLLKMFPLLSKSKPRGLREMI